MDTDLDVKSLESFNGGRNEWDVRNITPKRGIDFAANASKIIKIEINVTYWRMTT
jgi:hypothetical protein